MRAQLGLRLPRSHSHCLVAGADGDASLRPAHRPPRAIPAAQDDAAAMPIWPPEEILGAQGLPPGADTRAVRSLPGRPDYLDAPRSSASDRLGGLSQLQPRRDAVRACRLE